MRYAVIVKTVADMSPEQKTGHYAYLPAEHPFEVREFEDTLENLEAQFPDKTIVEVDQYNSEPVQAALESIFNEAIAESTKPWWRFW
jgi:hypothetical protein